MDHPVKYQVTLSAEERTYLANLLHKGTRQGRSYLRAQILLLADETQASDAAIARLLHTSHDTVYRTRKKCVERGVVDAITERPRSGAPRRLSEEQEQFLVALACAEPPVGHPVWTMHVLADTLVAWRIVDRVSEETVRTTLKKMRPSPGGRNSG